MSTRKERRASVLVRSRTRRMFALVVALGILIWYWSQAVLGKRVPKVAEEVPLTDGIHLLTARHDPQTPRGARAA